MYQVPFKALRGTWWIYLIWYLLTSECLQTRGDQTQLGRQLGYSVGKALLEEGQNALMPERDAVAQTARKMSFSSDVKALYGLKRWLSG